jgi:hypothetical protein
MAVRLDQMIAEPHSRTDQEDTVHFKIKESLLNYDYEIVISLLSSL